VHAERRCLFFAQAFTFAFLLAVGPSCAPALTSTTPAASDPPRATDGPSAPLVDAGAVRVCMHDTKDIAPCVEDCDRGIAFACAVVAQRLERGEGVAQDLTRAVRLQERASELRDATSCVNAARMHGSGRGVPPSRQQQVELLGAACKLGDAAACATAARAFATGAGIPRDDARASDLMRRACVNGLGSACEETEREP
jgi:TPR repeat protein